MIFQPLGMHDSWIGVPSGAYHHYGTRIGWMFHSDKSPLEAHPFWNSEQGCAQVKPGSNTRGPIRELGKFYEWLLDAHTPSAQADQRVLQQKTIRALTTCTRKGMFDHTFRHVIDFGPGFLINSNQYGAESVPYGYGRYCSRGTFGHSGSQCACGFADPQHRLVVAWAVNGRPGEALHQQRARELNSAIYEDLRFAGQ
jgi:CubicO group peptidase (beta-lactamase class C family)